MSSILLLIVMSSFDIWLTFSYVKYFAEVQREKPKALTLFGIISVNLGKLICDLIALLCFLTHWPVIRIYGLFIHRSYVAFLCAEVMER